MCNIPFFFVHSKAEIEKLAQDIADEQKDLEQRQSAIVKENEEKQAKSAIKIQSLWRGHRYA